MQRLRVWLRSQAARQERERCLEESLLCYRFAGYAWRRLRLLAWTRLLATLVHVVEFSFLLEVFRHKGVLSSLAVQNSCLLLSGIYWGCLEIMRTQVRTAHSKNAAALEVGVWIRTSIGLAAGTVALPCAVVAIRLILFGEDFLLLDLYALICFLRLGLDLPLRTYYSGVYALYRVARPAAAIVLCELSGLAAVLLVWRWLGPWSFPIGLLFSVLVSRGFTFYVTRRAYRLLRFPTPHWKRSRRGRARLSELLPAGLAGASARLGPLLVLALIWGRHRDKGAFVLIVHLLAPLLSATASWPQVFYLDFKRLEHDACLLLRRRLLARLAPLSLVVGAGLWGLGVATAATRTMSLTLALALLPIFLAQSFLAGLQLSHFARGEFQKLSMNSVVLALGLLVATAMTVDSGSRTMAVTGIMALCIVLLGVGRVRPRSLLFGRKDSLAAWRSALAAVRAPVSVGWISLQKSRGRELEVLATWLTERIGAMGAVTVLGGRWLIWYQSPGPLLGRAELVTRAGGLIASIGGLSGRASGPLALEAFRSLDWVGIPVSGTASDVDQLLAVFKRRFPTGRAVNLYDPSTLASLSTYTPLQRQELWLDALRHATGRRGRLADMDVSTLTCSGEIRLIFVLSKQIPHKDRRDWKALLAAAQFSDGDQSSSKGPMSTGADRALPVRS